MSHNVFKLSRDYKEVKSALVGNFHIFMAETVTMGFPNQVDKDMWECQLSSLEFRGGLDDSPSCVWLPFHD
jgi:hypothetical protein